MRAPVRRSVLVVAAAVALAGCTADPPPPIEATDTLRTTTAAATQKAIVVAVDDIGLGFNPHLLADLSPTNSAVSALVLPSAFRPVINPDRPGVVDRVPDTGVLVSADVTAQEPFTVTYQIRDDAQWSDGAPIAAEDFHYLWQQMITEPGVVEPAGYEMISDVDSSGGGKTVRVTMKAPYPAWRELFSDLLPSHLIKDSPGGFATGLADNIPVSGSHFRIRNVDRGRDEILLERNDRYWGTPAKPDQILMRRGGSPAQLADSMRSGDTQVAVVHGGNPTKVQLSTIPDVRVASMFQPRVLRLTLNGRAGVFTDDRVRRAVLATIDPQLLAAVGAQNTAEPDPARAQVLSPSDPGYAATQPPRPGPATAAGLLAEAGFERIPTPVTGPQPPPAPTVYARSGTPLAVRLGVSQNDDTAIAVANTAADQLRGSGFNASVRVLEPAELYGPALLQDTVDAVVGWDRAGGDPATSLASRYSCPGAPAAGVSPSTAPGGSDEPKRPAPTNLSGICDPSLQPAIDAALRGDGDVAELLAEAEPKLWQLSVVQPILQDQTLVAAGPGVSGVTLSGAPPVGIFGDAEQWARTP